MKELGVWGGNPSVTWNDYLQRWLMVWHRWDPPNILLSHSQDLLHWAPAVRIVVVRLSCNPPVMRPLHPCSYAHALSVCSTTHRTCRTRRLLRALSR